MCAAEQTEIDAHEIERRAETVLRNVPDFIWDGESVPVPIEEIVDSVYGLLVRDVDDMSSAPVPGGIATSEWISGLLLPTHGEIWVNAEDARRWPPRRRFTIGHELGHWELHRTGQQTLFCRAGHVDPDQDLQGGSAEPLPTGGTASLDPGSTEPPLENQPDPDRPPRPPAEEEADVFSAALLMPVCLVRTHHADCAGDITELCRRFNCSDKAMRRRVASSNL